MKVIRNAYFWVLLGSIVFIGLMDWSSHFHRTQEQAYQEAEERDESAVAVLSPFWEGFATACVVIGAFGVVYRQQHPKTPSESKNSPVG